MEADEQSNKPCASQTRALKVTSSVGASDAVAKQKKRIWALKRDLTAVAKERDSLRQQLEQREGKRFQ